MKKIIGFLLSMAAVFSLASCKSDKLNDQPVESGPVAPGPDDPDYGTPVDATFYVEIGPEAKAFADGTTVDRLYVGIYEIGSGDKFTWVADNSTDPAVISSKTASVTFNDAIQRGKSYLVIFWAQKDGAPYTIDWATSATSGPLVSMNGTGDANDESRDAFYGCYETGAVTSDINLTGSPIELSRPFAQVNILVPNSNIDNLTDQVSSTMSISDAPTVLNLATKATSGFVKWDFHPTSISEPAFGEFANTHKYVAMNYVLVDQTAADPRYRVEYSVLCGSQSALDKTIANMPLRRNCRTNIVGNIFDENFSIIIPAAINPGMYGDFFLTSAVLTVGQSEANAIEMTRGQTYSVEIGLSRVIYFDDDKPEITVNPASVATSEWNLVTGRLEITPQVENGSAVITLVFPEINWSGTTYSAAIVKVYIKVGNG